MAVAVLATCLSTASASNGSLPGEQLLVFVASGGEIARSFEELHLPELRAAAEELGVEVRVIDVAGGAPSEVTLTPLLVYQNHRGRSIFQARYADAGKLVHFVRTSRAIPLENAPLSKQRIPVLVEGRSVTAAPVKVTELTGRLPADHDPEAFLRRAEAAPPRRSATRSIR